jgi:hypothetical protein
VVGAVEDVDRRCAPTFPAGDVAALEALVRDQVARLQSDRANRDVRELARREAQRLFAPDIIGRQAVALLEEVAAGGRQVANA